MGDHLTSGCLSYPLVFCPARPPDDDLDMEWNEDTEAPYLAPAAQPKEPKQPRKKKAKKEAAAPLEAAATQLPEDFAAALAAATMVREPSNAAGAAGAAADGGAPSAGPAGAASMGQPSMGAASMGAPSQGAISGFGPGASMGEAAAAEVQQAQQALPPQDVQQPAAAPPAAAAPAVQAKPKVKIKVGGGAPAAQQLPQREPSRESGVVWWEGRGMVEGCGRFEAVSAVREKRLLQQAALVCTAS